MDKIRVALVDYGSRVEVYDRPAADKDARLLGEARKGSKQDMYKGWYVSVADRTTIDDTKAAAKATLRRWAEPIVANIAAAAERLAAEPRCACGRTDVLPDGKCPACSIATVAIADGSRS